MRIVAGQFRRRQLLANPGMTTRPITDRAKVMLFDRIEPRLAGRRIGDFFAGTGSLGLEALSRGAERVVFAEQDHRAHELLRQNVASLGVEDRALCWRVNALRSSFKPKGTPAWFPYGVVFFDPPYSLTEKVLPGDAVYEALARLGTDDVMEANGLIVLRTSREATAELPSPWQIGERLEISSMALWLLEKHRGEEISDE